MHAVISVKKQKKMEVQETIVMIKIALLTLMTQNVNMMIYEIY